MFRSLKLSLVLLVLWSSVAFAQQTSDVDFLPDMKEESRSVLNDQLRRSNRRLMLLENGISLTTGVTGILPLVNGGTARALTDPGADRILFWDESSNYLDFLSLGTGLSFSTTTLNVSDGHTLVSGFGDSTPFGDGTCNTEGEINKSFVRYCWANSGNGSPATFYSTSWLKTEQVNTVKGKIYVDVTINYDATITVNIGGQTDSEIMTANTEGLTPELSIDVSGLTNGTWYTFSFIGDHASSGSGIVSSEVDYWAFYGE